MNDARYWLPWLRLVQTRAAAAERPTSGGASPALRVACPHCTNTDTLSLHCPGDRCGWVRCTCGALIYSRRRHRHPRHQTTADTCHDPAFAV